MCQPFLANQSQLAQLIGHIKHMGLADMCKDLHMVSFTMYSAHNLALILCTSAVKWKVFFRTLLS